jgi:dihydrofolate synthase/folylpolyglutamate synthase
MDLLGNTLQEIATEKAGIIKPQVPVIIGEQRSETERIFFEHSVHKQCPLYYAETMWDLVRVKQDNTNQYFKAVHRAKREMHDLKTDLFGGYQHNNIKTVLAAVDVLSSQMPKLNFDTVYRALSKVKRLTGLRGRWDVMQQSPMIVVDVAHNTAGLTEVMKQFANITAAKKHIILGFVKDKDVANTLALMPKNAVYHFCNAQIPRALPAKELQEVAAEAGLQGETYASVADAVRTVKATISTDSAVLITGSFFIVGEAMEYLNVNNGMLFPSTLE